MFWFSYLFNLHARRWSLFIIHYSLPAKTIYTQHIYGAVTIKRWHVIVWKVIKTVEAAGLRGRIMKD